jgi:hypothetical protein
MIKAYNKKTGEKSTFFFVILIKNVDPTSTPLVRGIFLNNTTPLDSAPILKEGIKEEFKNDFSSLIPLGFGVYNKQRGVEIGLGISNPFELWLVPILISVVERFRLAEKIIEFVDKQGGSQPSRYVKN